MLSATHSCNFLGDRLRDIVFMDLPSDQLVCLTFCRLILILIYLLTAIGLTPGGSSTVHIYTQTIHRTTQLTTWLEGFLGFESRMAKVKLMMN